MAVPDLKKIPPLSVNISEFRGLNEDEAIHIPELVKNRKCTDVAFLVVFIISILAMIILLIFCTVSGTDYTRFINGYDRCGDTCGTLNLPKSGRNCSGKNLTEKPFMRYAFTEVVKNHLLPDECVNKCDPPDRLLFRRCFPSTDGPLDKASNRIVTLNEFMNDFRNSSVVVVVSTVLIGLALSITLFLCLHHFPGLTVFGILAITLFSLFCFTTYIWYGFLNDTRSKGFLIVGIISTIAIFLLCVLICYFHDRYYLVIGIFAEATQAISKTPALLLCPLVSLLILTIVITSMIFLTALMSTNQHLKRVSPSFNEYVETRLSTASISYLVFQTIWILAVTNGCQCIIVAAPVSAYYFQKDKSVVWIPVLESCYMLIRFHLGTVIFGSLFITILTCARICLKMFEDRLTCGGNVKCCEYCLVCTEEIVHYFTKKAYIQTAMHGKSLYKSGMRAARLLWANLMDTIYLDIVGDFIILCATILIILIALGVVISVLYVTELSLTYFWPILTVGVGITGVSVYFFTQVINVAIETIFLCYCEDKLLNNGQDKPYLMSEQLKNLVNKAKKTARSREE